MPDKPPGPDLDQLQNMGLDVDRIRRALRRRVGLLVTGAAIVTAGAWVEPAALGLPAPARVVVMLVGGLVGLGGLLGIRRGAGCLAQLVAIVWISAIACGMGPSDRPTLMVLTAGLVALVGAALLLPRNRNPSMFNVTVPRDRVAPGSTPGRDVIDVEARETEPDDPAR